MFKHTKRENQIISALINAAGYTTSEELAAIASVSIRTIKRDISSVAIILHANGAKLVSKKKKGYQVEILDAERFWDLKRSLQMDINNGTFFNQSRRSYIKLLLCILVSANAPITIDQLANKLFFSEKTVSLYLDEIRENLQCFKLKLSSKPKQGLFIEGAEFNKRMLALELLRGNYHFSPNEKYYQGYYDLFYSDSYSNIKQLTLSSLFNHRIHIYNTSTCKVFNYIILATNRKAQNNPIVVEESLAAVVRQHVAYTCAKHIFSSAAYEMADDEIIALALLIMENENIVSSDYTQNSSDYFLLKSASYREQIIRFCKAVYNIDFESIPYFSEGLTSFLIPFVVKNEAGIACSITYSKDILGAATPKDPLAVNIAKTILQHLEKHFGTVYNVTDIQRLLTVFSFTCNSIQYRYNKLKVCNVISSICSIAAIQIAEVSKKHLDKICDFSTIDYWEYPFIQEADVMLIDMYPKISHKYDIETIYFDSSGILCSYETALKEALVHGYQISGSIKKLAGITNIYTNIICNDLSDLFKMFAFKYATSNISSFYSNYDIKDFDYSIISDNLAYIYIPKRFTDHEFFDIHGLSRRIETKSHKSFSTLIIASIELSLEDFKTLDIILRRFASDMLCLADIFSSNNIEPIYREIVLDSLKSV